MAVAFKSAVEAGRIAYEVGLGHERDTANATSPLDTILRQNA
jgi:thiazole synthase